MHHFKIYHSNEKPIIYIHYGVGKKLRRYGHSQGQSMFKNISSVRFLFLQSIWVNHHSDEKQASCEEIIAFSLRLSMISPFMYTSNDGVCLKKSTARHRKCLSGRGLLLTRGLTIMSARIKLFHVLCFNFRACGAN